MALTKAKALDGPDVGINDGIKKDPSPGYGEGRKKGKFPTWLASATSGQPGFDRPCAGVRWFST